MRPALFLDRDGVINEEVGYVSDYAQIRFVPGIVTLIAAANAAGWPVIVVTNQAGIGRGLYTEAQFEAVMASMRHDLEMQGCRIEAVYFSPHHPEHGVGAYRRESDCRKPEPGMMLRAAREHAIDLPQSFLVGDRISDMQAGTAAGIVNLFLLGSMETFELGADSNFCPVKELDEVTKRLWTVLAARHGQRKLP